MLTFLLNFPAKVSSAVNASRGPATTAASKYRIMGCSSRGMENRKAVKTSMAKRPLNLQQFWSPQENRAVQAHIGLDHPERCQWAFENPTWAIAEAGGREPARFPGGGLPCLPANRLAFPE